MSTKILTSEKEIANNKKNVIAKRKEEIKNSKNSIFENNDFLSLEKKVSSLKVKEKVSSNERKKMYKFENSNLTKEETKKLRQKMRTIRNRFANNVILHFQQKNEELLKKEVKEFKEFYLKNYILNDYSLISISFNNRDKETINLLNPFLEIVKLLK